MSKYTTEVRYICETYAGHTESQDYAKIDDIIANSIDKIFDFDFPIFDENYRSVLETKIIRHYYTREIGFETVALWKHFLNMRMNEIMPKYNKLYLSENLITEPFKNVDYTESYEGTGAGTNKNIDKSDTTDTTTGTTTNGIQETVNEDIADNKTNERDHSSDSMDKYADTPQGGLSNLRNDEYLTNARQIEFSENEDGSETYSRDRDVTSASTNTGTYSDNKKSVYNMTKEGQFSNTDEYLKHIKGYNGNKTLSEMLVEFRNTFINIDLMVINELNDLFMGVW